MTSQELYAIYEGYPSVQTDSRQVKAGDLFFALKGPNFNGNLFAAQALEDGAAYAIVDDPAVVKNERTLLVPDVLQSLQDLALFHRKQFSIPFLAITGSNGKTTTKELIHAVLSRQYRTYTTQGNLNNHIGIPLTLLRIRKDAEMAVIEMGANHQHEIEGYCKYVLPTHALITNCGKAHLEGFGGVEGVRKGKGELYDFLKTHGGIAFVMWDYDYLHDMSRGIPRIIKYGTSEEADLRGKLLRAEPFLSLSIEKGAAATVIQTRLVGDYNLPNVLAAVAVGKFFEVPEAAIREAIESYTPSNSRSQWIERGSNQFILDAYNANPSSMQAAVENFARSGPGKKVLLLGAMAELGPESLEEHRKLVQLIQRYNWEEVILVGGDFLRIDHPFRRFSDSDSAAQWFRQQDWQHTRFLLKGSRSYRMEKLLEA